MRVKKNPLRAAWNLGCDLVRNAVVALATSPPQLSVIAMSAALGLFLELLPVRPAWINAARLD